METQQQPAPKLPENEEGEEVAFIKLLEERLEKHDDNRRAVQDKIREVCGELHAKIDKLEERINKELEGKFIHEDSRLQASLHKVRENDSDTALQKVKAELLVFQSYELIENKVFNTDFSTLYKLKTERRIIPELMEMRKPTNIRVTDVNIGRVSVDFTCINPYEVRVLSDYNFMGQIKYKCLLFKNDNERESKEVYPLYKNEGNDPFTFTPDILYAGTTYGIRVEMVVGDRENEWSDGVAEFKTPEFKEWCAWKECPDYVDDGRKYIVDEDNPRIATKTNNQDLCTIIGNTPISPNTVTSWNIKVLKSKDNDGDSIFIGVAPNDINQNVNHIDSNYGKRGWYFACYFSALCSGPPHNYDFKEYGPRKEYGQYVHTGDSVGVVVDTANGDLSFVLNGVNLGVAYEGIPLDKPLVPCVLLRYEGDSVELDTSEAKDTEVDSSIPAPLNIITKSIAWDTITLAWDKADDASFYQIEVDGSKSWGASTTNLFIKRGLLPDTEHSFRVRTVRGSSVSEWSDIFKGKTLKAPEFSECVWKKCPGDVGGNRKYIVNEKNPRVATKVNGDNYDDYCTIIGNTPIPFNKVTSWNIKILKSKYNNGGNIFIGIAPFDINQNTNDNWNKCGWYFACYYSVLFSGPPHNYIYKKYGPRKENGQYVHTGDSVGVVMDTTKGDLSFVLNGVDLGVAYEGIPLDKPLVPCVLLYYQGDSVKLDTSEVKIGKAPDNGSCVIS